MNAYTTGNAIVDAMGELRISGNVIAETWYKTIVKESGKPNLRAILFLSDIVYWYRPKEERDEATGDLMGYSKKFRADLLQRSYKELAEHFGCSKGEAQATIADLERLGVVKRVFRTEVRNGVRSNNIMYLALDVDVLRKLTYPQDDETPMPKNRDSLSRKNRTAMPEKTDRVSRKKGTAMPKFRETNTENNSETIQPEITPSIHPQTAAQSATAGADSSSTQMGGLSDEELSCFVEEEIERSGVIPFRYFDNRRSMTAAIEYLSCSQEISPLHFGRSEAKYNAFCMIVDCLIEMACEKRPQNYHGSHVANGTKVIEKLNGCIKADHYLTEFIDDAINDFEKAAESRKIKNIRAYMKSVIWTSLSSYKVKLDAELKHDLGI